MKSKCSFQLATFRTMLLILIWSYTITAAIPSMAQNVVRPEDVISAVRLNNIDAFDRMAGKLQLQQKNLTAQLVDIFKDAQSPVLTKGAAAYCLGELRASEVVNVLALGIALEINSVSNDHLTLLQGPIVMKALIKIGNPSIPAVMKNLAESDDAKVRALSLQVIERIDKDKDISALRLQKAIKAETDAQKQARLQVALKALSGA